MSVKSQDKPLKSSEPDMPPQDRFGGHFFSMHRDILAFMVKNQQYGNLVKLNLFGTVAYQANAPELIGELLLNSQVWQKSKFYRGTLRDYLGEGLVISEGAAWKRQHQIIQPAFHSQRIAAYAETMVTYSLELLAAWRDGEQRDMAAELMNLTFRIAAKTLFGTEVGNLPEELANSVNFMLEDIGHSSQSLIPLPPWFPTPRRRRRKQAIEHLDQAIFSLIAARRKAGDDTGDLLSMLLSSQDENGQFMSDLELRNEVLTLILAGQETTATALSWLLYLLVQHPIVLAQLEAEILDTIGKRPATLVDLKTLSSLEKIIKEGLRLYPPVWILSRENPDNAQLGGYSIASHSSVMVSLWSLHRNPRYYSEPEAFKPERWTETFQSSLPRYAYLPFGAGPRICIGNAFAMMEIQLVLVTLLQQFRFYQIPGYVPELAPYGTLRPKHGMPVRLEKRR